MCIGSSFDLDSNLMALRFLPSPIPFSVAAGVWAWAHPWPTTRSIGAKVISLKRFSGFIQTRLPSQLPLPASDTDGMNGSEMIHGKRLIGSGREKMLIASLVGICVRRGLGDGAGELLTELCDSLVEDLGDGADGFGG